MYYAYATEIPGSCDDLVAVEVQGLVKVWPPEEAARRAQMLWQMATRRARTGRRVPLFLLGFHGESAGVVDAFRLSLQVQEVATELLAAEYRLSGKCDDPVDRMYVVLGGEAGSA